MERSDDFRRNARGQGFTLVELSVVLVIIALIIGGIIVGGDLIAAAQVRAQIAQIHKFHGAVNTFVSKYDWLPGDLNASAASRMGFAPRGQYEGQGDGNGFLTGAWQNLPAMTCNCYEMGELALFWVDLSAAGLVEGNFSSATATTWGAAGPYNGVNGYVGEQIGKYMPRAKIGRENYVYVFGMAAGLSFSGTVTSPVSHFFGVAAINFLSLHGVDSAPNIPVHAAFNIDRKTDDGLPYSGDTQVARPYGEHIQNIPNINLINATPADATTCADNNNTYAGAWRYSTSVDNGANPVCALVFGFQ